MSYAMSGRGYSKPPAGSQIDWSHQLAQGIILCLPLNEVAGSSINDLAAGRRLSLTGGATLSGTKRGSGLVNTSPSAAWASIPSAGFIPLRNVTVVHGLRKRGTNQNSSAFGINPESSAARCSAHVPFGDGVVYWDFGGTSSGTTRLSVAGLTYGDNIWAFTTGARGMEVWQDGIKRGSNTANPTRTATTNAYAFGGGSGALVFDQIDAHFFYMYSRQLSENEIRWITAEPFVLFTPPHYRKFFVPPPPPDLVEGTSALTGEVSTLSATGVVYTAGPAALTGEVSTLSGTGTVAATGTAALTGEVATLSATGETFSEFTGTAALVGEVSTLSATGTVAATGTAALTGEIATLAATGTHVAAGVGGYKNLLLLGVG